MGKALTLIVKPTDECNFSCTYCYGAHSQSRNNRMTLDLYSQLLEKCINSGYSDLKTIWHGGEPLLMGADFYSDAVQVQDHYSNSHGTRFLNSLQTNGSLIDDECASVFRNNDFRVCVSFDGWGGKISRPRAEEALSGIKLLKSYGLYPSILSVVTSETVDDLPLLYEFVKDEALSWKFNRVFSHGGMPDAEQLAVPDEAYAQAILPLFSEWLCDSSNYVSVASFVTYLKMYVGIPDVCALTSCLTKFVCVDSDGDVYSCNRLASSDYRLGNLSFMSSIDSAFETPIFKKLLKNAIARRNYCMDICEHYEVCHGGCNAGAIFEGDPRKPGFDECRELHQVFPLIKKILNNALEFESINLNRMAKQILGRIK